ncbi:hypothetical protein RHMOL_Rhmol03G0030400 [Rhododendron molle]|uniref:Uncharacterized protein n=1 Tax=Rhododendron molle TaxID=49168 RepID=A0ACC0PCB2_RHOML|nr:hypothetical protein RHMOL_Rhmol03G0030400 [Rhododendron molle]
MADPLTLACCLGKIGEIVLGGIGDCLIDPIKRQFTYMCCFHWNIMELETQLKGLETTRQGVQMGVDENRRKVRVIGPNVEDWLNSANEVTTEIEGIIQDKAKVKEGCLNGWCPNLKLRYSLSRTAVKKTKVVVDLKADGVQYTQSSYSPPPACLEITTNRDFMGFESRRLIMEEIIKALKHDEINLIGVCGMGGVGKTILVNEVAKRVKEGNHFDEVAMAIVGQKLDLTNVQACIGDTLGLKNLCNTKSPIERANLLRKRLLPDDKKVLVILDDIWEEFDLQAMGIPLECSKNFKMLYTSRTQDLWHGLRTKKEIPLELLSKDEALQLFREKAGDLADARDLQPIAIQIVNECGRLPLALALIGSALSKKCGRNAEICEENTIKMMWEEMLDRLTCPTSTPGDMDLSSKMELSYKYLQDEEAKGLFLLCCLFQEDEDIRLEDLTRYGFGLSLFKGINKMRQARRRVFALVDDLKSRYLLLDSKEEEQCVKVHDVVRDMGISIASKDTFALVSHGAISQWPKTAKHEHYISVISHQIEKLPERLMLYPNLEFLMLRCQRLKELPPNFFEGMGELKVLELPRFDGFLTLPSLRNLTTLSLERFYGTLDNVSLIGGIPNLETLSFRNSGIKELPEKIGELVNLRLLDLRETCSLTRIPPGVISRLRHLEELYFWGSYFSYWEGEGNEEEAINANLREFEFLSDLSTLEIMIESNVLIPKVAIFGKLEIYKVVIADHSIIFGSLNHPDRMIFSERFERELRGKERALWVEESIPMNPIPSYHGGIDRLLRSSDFLRLEGDVCNDLVRELLPRDGVNGLQQKKCLQIRKCDTPECLANTTNPVHLSTSPAPAVFPILKELDLRLLPKLREICCGPVPAGSFGELTSMFVGACERLENLFQLPVEGCLARLESLSIGSCDMMVEVFRKDEGEEVQVATNNRLIVFPKLEVLELGYLPILVGFCRGIDQIDFPQLKCLNLQELGGFNSLFHDNCNLSSNPEQNDNVGFFSLFPQKVSLPNLEILKLATLPNLERLGHGPLPVGSFSKLKECSVGSCGKLLCVFPSQLLLMLPELQKVTLESCKSLEVVFELEGLESNEPNPEILSPLKFVKLNYLPQLNCISKRDPMGFKYIQTLAIFDCNSLRYVFAPTMTKSIPQLRNLEIWDCEMLSRIVAEENGLGESSVDEVEFPQLESLELCNLPNLVSFYPNVNANTTTLAKSTDHNHNPLQPQPLFNEKVAFPGLKYLVLFKLQNVSCLWGSELPTNSFSKLEKLKVTGCASWRNFPCISWIGDLNDTTQGLQEVAQLLYPKSTSIGDVLALGSNGTMTGWKRQKRGEEVLTTSMQPPPASTFLAFHPKDNNMIAIGMEDSTIRICNFWMTLVKSELKGHKKRITGLAFSKNLNILVSSGADAQLCIWSIDTWEKLKSVSIQLPAGKACNGDTRVEFHSNQIRLLVSHETQLAIYDASEMDRIRQWVLQDVFLAPISFAVYSCDSRLVYTSFCDGNIGVFDADSLTLTCHIAPSIYLQPRFLSGGQAVYPRVIAANREKPNKFAIGLTNGVVVFMKPQQLVGKWGLSPSTVDYGMLNDRTMSSPNTSNHTPDQNQRKEEEGEKEDVDEEVDLNEEDQEEERKKKVKGKAPQSG